MAGETDLIGMLIANPPAFYGLSLLIIFFLGSIVFWGARKRAVSGE
ncbi:MAG: hypothetical protein QXN71_03355 [Candidatus Aenigmatarchaeota archaeon]